MLGENEESAMKDKGRKDVFRRTWLEQMNVKRQEMQINDELLRLPHDEVGSDVPADSPMKTSLY